MNPIDVGASTVGAPSTLRDHTRPIWPIHSRLVRVKPGVHGMADGTSAALRLGGLHCDDHWFRAEQYLFPQSRPTDRDIMPHRGLHEWCSLARVPIIRWQEAICSYRMTPWLSY